MNEITWKKLFGAWNKAIIKILMIAPNAILNQGEPDKAKPAKDMITRLIPALIMVLSAASITNLSTRAYSHHAGLASYLVGAGLAVLVPLAVFVALKIDERYKVWTWGIAGVFALMSALIQIQVYMPATISWARWDQVAEAIAFGGGVPTAECLLAAMEAFLLVQAQRTEQAEKQAQLDAEKQRQADEAAHQAAALERQRQTEETIRLAEFERRKQEIELHNYENQLAQQAELQRLAAEAKLEAERKAAEARYEIERMKLEAKLSNPGVHNKKKRSVQAPETPVHLAPNTPVDSEGVQSADSRRKLIMDTLMDTGWTNVSDFQRRTKISRATLHRDLVALEQAGQLRITRNAKNEIVNVEIAIMFELPLPSVHVNGKA